MNDTGETPTVVDSGWVEAPATSSINRYKFVNMAFAGTGAPSELHVVFEEFVPKTTRGTYKPQQLYIYEMTDHFALQGVFNAMKLAEHPNSVLDRECKKTGVPVRGPLTPEG